MTARAASNSAGIVDTASGAPRALEGRLLRAGVRRVRVLVGSVADGEPAVASARRLAAAYPGRLVLGLAAAARAVRAERVVLAVEERARELAVEERVRELALPGVSVVRVPDVARCGEPADLALDAAGLAVPPGADPLDHGVLVLDGVALIELGAALEGAPVTERAITVAGAVARPGVGLVPVGTSIEEVIELAGGATGGAGWVVLGDGPLAGRPLDRDDVITKATRALFVGAASSDLVRRARAPLTDWLRRSRSACERCAACSDICPPRLLGGRLRPDELVRALATGRGALGELAAALECGACGLCDVACPSGLSPRALVTAAARAAADEGGRRPEPGLPLAERSVRRLGLGLVARRLGLGEAALDPPWQSWAARPRAVAVPLKQSLGTAARPVVVPGALVTRGQRIASVPDGADGVHMHAPIDGLVRAIAAGAIHIVRG